MNYIQKLNDLGFKLNGLENQKTKCPKCQPPHNPRDFPVSLSFTEDVVLWNCHHCGYKGAVSIKRDYIEKDLSLIHI